MFTPAIILTNNFRRRYSYNNVIVDRARKLDLFWRYDVYSAYKVLIQQDRGLYGSGFFCGTEGWYEQIALPAALTAAESPS